jgi:regulator of sigma E protease
MEWLTNVWTIALVAVGIGGVIFVHECGHFFAARWCGVRVECFSLGFGPRLFGWRRGGTLYQLALLPLGGYVKMAGEEGAAGRAPAPDELPAKSVGQRFLIYSGGVIANVLLGLVVFPILFAHGVPFDEPLIGTVTPGGPAWSAGIEPGSRVVRVNDRAVTKFGDIATEVALGSPERVEIEYLDPAGERRVVVVIPSWDPRLGINTIGVSPGVDREGRIAVTPDSAAQRAGLRDGDRLVAVESPVGGRTLYEELGLKHVASAPLRARFERDGKAMDVEVVPAALPGEGAVRLGVMPLYGSVVALRDDPRVQALGLAVGDRIVAVDGRPLRNEHDFLAALHGGAAQLEVERAGVGRTVELGGLDVEARHALGRAIALGSDLEGTRVLVTPDSPAERAGLRDEDRIVRVDGADARAYADIKAGLEGKRADETVALVVERVENGAPRLLDVTAKLASVPTLSYGIDLENAEYVYKVAGFVPAIVEGGRASWTFLEEGWLTLKRIVNRQVSSENIGGIITIGRVSHHFAESGIASLLFFLCMLSMNLAFLNVLPIPVLDGGHLLFLLIEKIKGSPVSERVMGYSQMVGIVLILSLMVFVTFNDVKRLFVN